MAQLKITNGFEGMTDLDFLGKVRFIISQMTGRPEFPTPDPSMATVTTLANEFEQDIQDAEAGGSVEKLARDEKKEELIDTMHNLGNYVLFTAKGDRLIAEKSGFTVSKDPSPRPPIEKPAELVLADGPNPGDILLKFRRVLAATGYQYQISTDPADESKWVNSHDTVRKKLFTGLVSATRYYVRVIALGTNGQSVYSDVVSRVAQ